MALFSRKKEASETAATPAVTKTSERTAFITDTNIDGVIIKPHLTEKSVMQGDKQVYTFMVHKSATKHAVINAIRSIYNVTPVKVNIVNKLPRQTMSRAKGRVVSEKGYKKAYVYLKAGDSITLV